MHFFLLFSFPFLRFKKQLYNLANNDVCTVHMKNYTGRYSTGIQKRKARKGDLKTRKQELWERALNLDLLLEWYKHKNALNFWPFIIMLKYKIRAFRPRFFWQKNLQQHPGFCCAAPWIWVKSRPWRKIEGGGYKSKGPFTLCEPHKHTFNTYYFRLVPLYTWTHNSIFAKLPQAKWALKMFLVWAHTTYF